MLTPPPRMSSPSTTTSPAWTPMRSSIRRSAGIPALRSAMRACMSAAPETASTTEENSARKPTPVVLTIRPPCRAITGSSVARCPFQVRIVPASSHPTSAL